MNQHTVMSQLSNPSKDLSDRACMAKFRIPGGKCSIKWSTSEWGEPQCVTSEFDDTKMCDLQRVRRYPHNLLLFLLREFRCEIWQNNIKRKTVNKMYCEATLDSFETETITNHKECRI